MSKFANYNPPTVVVPLVWVNGGILVIRRALAHGYGKICLPGGFQEMGDSWIDTLVKETHEESGVHTGVNWKIFDYQSIEGNTKNLLIASYEGPEPQYTPWIETQLAAQEVRETLEVLIWTPELDVEWAFPLHESAAKTYWVSKSTQKIDTP